MQFGRDSYNLLMNSGRHARLLPWIAKRVEIGRVHQDSLVFVLYASSFIPPRICSMIHEELCWKCAMEHLPAPEFGPFYGWERQRQEDFLIFQTINVVSLPADLSNTPILDVTTEHDCHQTWMFSEWISDPCGSNRSQTIFLQLWCNSTEDTYEKIFFPVSILGRLWALANATCFF